MYMLVKIIDFVSAVTIYRYEFRRRF